MTIDNASQSHITNILHPISHDLRAPLNRILGLVQLINFSREKLDDEQKNYVDKIHQVTSDGIDMINNMIDAYDLETGQFQERMEPVDIRELLESRIDSYRDVATIKHIEIQYTFTTPQPVRVIVDKLLAGRIIDNLLSNAIKFSPEHKKIYIHMESGKDFVLFTVRDEGPGIGQYEIKQLYRKFHKLNIRPTAGETTTSLGLYVVKTMLQKIHGDIQCTSSPEKGTEFKVTMCKKP